MPSSAWAERCDRWCFYALCAAVFVAPLPLASNRQWAVALLAMALGALLALRLMVLAHQGLTGMGAAHRSWRLLILAAPFAVVAAVGMVHMMPLAGADTLAAHPHPFSGWHHLLRTAVYGCAALLVLLTMRSPSRVRTLLLVLAGAAMVQAVLAVWLSAGRGTYWYLYTDFQRGTRATGTFANPDHLAGYMELGLAAGLGLLLAQLGQRDGADGAAARLWQHRLLQALRFALSGKMVLRLGLVLMVVALVMSHSRMGNAAFFAAMLAVGVLVAVRSVKLRKPALVLVASMALVDIVVIGQWVGLDKVVQRMQDTAVATAAHSRAGVSVLADEFGGITAVPSREESLQQRLRIPALSLPLISQAPWLGHGGDAYAQLFPGIKPPGFPHFWSHAHNDYVQIAVDVGGIGLGALLVLVVATLVQAVRLIKDTQPRLNRGVGAGGTLAILALGLHAWVDFNFHIVANALTFVVLLALVWATARLHPGGSRHHSGTLSHGRGDAPRDTVAL